MEERDGFPSRRVAAWRFVPRTLCAVAMLVGAGTLTPQFAVAAQTYDECVRHDCAMGDYIGCGQNCRQPGSRLGTVPPPPTLYGAIAVETRTLVTGAAKGRASRADAERQAMAMCRRGGGSASGCTIAVSGHNVCLALATSREAGGKTNRWGYWHSDDGWVSRRGAAKTCRGDGGTNCQIAVSFCAG